MTDVTASDVMLAGVLAQWDELRPRLHRYCARMAGSPFDGDDIVQSTFVKATSAYKDAMPIRNVEAWLFRIAHNAALDFIRSRTRRDSMFSELAPEAQELAHEMPDGEVSVRASLHHFMHLPVDQRSTVILKDVLGYSLREIGALVEMSIPAVKAALHRGRSRLRRLAETSEEMVPLPELSAEERIRLEDYVTRFNAREFDAVRAMLAEDVQLDLVSRKRMNGKRAVSTYFSNYARQPGWCARSVRVDGHPAIAVRDPGHREEHDEYFILLDWHDGQISKIRDFRYAGYAIEGATVGDL